MATWNAERRTPNAERLEPGFPAFRVVHCALGLFAQVTVHGAHEQPAKTELLGRLVRAFCVLRSAFCLGT